MENLQLHSTTIFIGTQAEERLSALNLISKNIESAGIAAAMVKLNATGNNTKSGPGIAEWDTFNKILRDFCCGVHWTKYQEHGIEGIISSDKRIRIIPSSGDAATGNPNQPASNKNPKGIKTVELVENVIQGSLFNGFPNQSDDDKIETYVLLYHYSNNKIKLELSKPSFIRKGKITAWSERIILDTVEFDKVNLTTNNDMEPEDEIDIPVLRKQNKG